MTHTRIKICGITRLDDALLAVASGADAIGLVFYADSPRSVTVEQATKIATAVPPFVSLVALFVDESAHTIANILAQLPVDIIQFHGDESPEFCQQFGRPYIKALRVRPETDVVALSDCYSSARGILLDAWRDGVPGGTGQTFDWRLATAKLARPLVLAGGLEPGNVGEAMEMTRPAAVDVSGGVELAPGVKDAVKIRDFIAAVRAADQRLDGQSNEQ